MAEDLSGMGQSRNVREGSLAKTNQKELINNLKKIKALEDEINKAIASGVDQRKKEFRNLTKSKREIEARNDVIAEGNELTKQEIADTDRLFDRSKKLGTTLISRENTLNRIGSVNRMQNRGLIDQSNALNTITKIEKEILGIKDQATAVAYDAKATEEEILEAQRNLSEELQSSNKERRELAEAAYDELEATKMAVKEAGRVTDIIKEQVNMTNRLEEASMGVLDIMETSRAAALGFLEAIKANPMLLVAAGAMALVKAFTAVNDARKEFQQGLGIARETSKDMGAELIGTAAKMKAIGIDTTAVAGNIQTSFGDLNAVTPNLISQLGIMEKGLGISAENSAVLTKSLMDVSGMSEEAALNQIQFTAQLAMANDVAPGEIMADIAENTETFAEFGKDGGANIAKAAIQARKLGLNLGTTAKIAESLLDFESSIEQEMQASLMIGKQLNFNKARELALSGDIAGAAADVMKQVGGQAEFEKLNVLQRKALADSIGVSVDELSKMAKGGEMKLKAPDKSTEEQLKSSMDASKLVMDEMLSAEKLLTIAIGALTVAVIANTAIQAARAFMGGGGMRGVIPGGKGKGAKPKLTKAGKVDGRTKLGKELKEKAAKSAAKKTAMKSTAKGLGKSALKKIPILGALGGLAFGASRLMKGDISGALMEVASGAASVIPGIGTAASVALDAALIAKDVSNASADTSSDLSDMAQKGAEAQVAAEAASKQEMLDGQELKQTQANMQDEVVDGTFRRMLEIQGLDSENMKKYQEESLKLLNQIIQANQQTGTKVENLTKE